MQRQETMPRFNPLEPRVEKLHCLKTPCFGAHPAEEKAIETASWQHRIYSTVFKCTGTCPPRCRGGEIMGRPHSTPRLETRYRLGRQTSVWLLSSNSVQ